MSASESASSDCEEYEKDVFYFESDHLALRGNPDYCHVVRLIATLNAQRIRVHQQMENLIIAKNKYLEEPHLILEKLRNNEPIVDPKYLTEIKIPTIDSEAILAKYDVKLKQESDAEASQPKVRGRFVDDSKPDSYNKLWTEKEQRRLDELLIKYPAEDIEMRRFAKIAMELGNRTTLQVASRVQKYFQKLHEAGLPIPGRVPKNRRVGSNTRAKLNCRGTTFFPGSSMRINSPEYDFLSPNFSMDSVDSPESSATNDTDSISVLNQMDAQDRKLFMLKKIRDEKAKQPEFYPPDNQHSTKCVKCNFNDVSLTRWYCQTCYTFIEFCDDCLVSQLLSDDFEHILHDMIADKERQLVTI